jgi:hypothetical protein
MLSSAMKAAYAETFYPTAGKQALCSGEAVVSVCLLPRSGADSETLGLRDLLVMTVDSLEQWKVRWGTRPSRETPRSSVGLVSSLQLAVYDEGGRG